MQINIIQADTNYLKNESSQNALIYIQNLFFLSKRFNESDKIIMLGKLQAHLCDSTEDKLNSNEVNLLRSLDSIKKY